VKREESSDGASFLSLLRKVHHDKKGAVSIETVLIIAAIALPILIFLVKFVWPRTRDYIKEMLETVFGGGQDPAG
jgi:hypothetical protein